MRPNTITEVEQLSERAQDLLVERTLWGLEPGSETELSVAVADVDGMAYGFERAVGALSVAMVASDPDPLPDSLRIRLEGLAETDAVRSINDPSRSMVGGSNQQSSPGPIPFAPAPAQDTRSAAGPLQWFGWVAAAACLTYAMFVTTPSTGPVAGVGPNLAVRLSAFEDEAVDLVRAGWAGLSALGAQNHPLDNGVAGEILWSDDQDTGFMTIRGIEPNDPSEFQYQLWIFDAERRTGDLPQFAADEISPLLTQRPVDGGVFDVALDEDGRLIVPIDAKLPVGKAAIFAVTKERPGGVVVSDRDIVFLALRG